MGLRAVLPGLMNYWFKNGEPPASTKSGFYENKILTVHSVIAKNALMFMHKIKNVPNLLPMSIKKIIPPSAPIFNGHDLSLSCVTTWSEKYGQHPYSNTLFYKGPLLAMSQCNINATSLPSLFNINIYKNSIKSMLLDQQNEGPTDEWPCFLLYKIPGLRKSQRNKDDCAY